jgi:HSP20 family protein
MTPVLTLFVPQIWRIMKGKLNLHPLADFQNYREAVRQMMEDGWVLPRDLLPSAVNAALIPVDLLDFGPEFVVKANLPGVKAEDVSLSIVEDKLTIRATLNEEQDTRGGTYLRRERKATAFIRILTLPAPVEAGRAEAVCKNGILTLTLPKSKNNRPRIIKTRAE